MAFRVRKFHSLFLGFIGLCLVAYSSYYSSPGLLFLENTVLGNDRSDALSTKVSSVSITTPKVKNMTVQANNEEIHHVITSTAVAQPIDLVVTPENITTNISAHHSSIQNAVQTPVKSQSPVASASASATVITVAAAAGVPAAASPAVANPATAADAVGKAIPTRKIYEHGFQVPGPMLCPDNGERIQLLIIVTSAPSHREARFAIRYTWGNFRQRKDVSIGFLVGSVSDIHKQELLNVEIDTYNDVIQSKFLDSYNNLTLKTLSLLEWVDTYCSKAKFVLKTDDDMFINVPRLLAFIDKHNNDKRTIFGRLAKKWKPIRNKASKYYVSLDQYKPPIFPDFTTGPAYLITSDIIHDLYVTALNKTYLKLEDVFLTGIVAQEMKVRRIHVSEFLNKRISLNACSIQKGISIHMIKYHEQFDLWKKLLDGKSKCS
ncbi:hypothetical protein R5R35_002530 [Gryllus longicercus]|uniref:Hexosyltransferase n=1 Tax=Gryllus longicercus TaxID=2509291 RepID=A0AAN9Z918_9ORTH